MSDHKNSYWIVNEEFDRKENTENKFIRWIKDFIK